MRSSKKQESRSELAALVRGLRLAFDERSWHGPNLMGSLRGVDLETAAWRPQPDRHNVWELVVHAAYWKYRVYRLITDEPPRSFSVEGSDWFSRPIDSSDTAWRADVDLLNDWHRRLLRAAESLEPGRLGNRPGKSRFTNAELIAGAASHDVYHAGQIQLLKRMKGDA